MAKIFAAGCLLILWTSLAGRVHGFAPPVIKAWSVRPNYEAAQTPARRSPRACTPPRAHRCSPRVRRRAAELGRQLEAFDPAEIRCPFFRRRATDTLEALVVVGTWLRARHKRVDLTFGLLPLSTRAGLNAHQRAAASRKAHNLPLGVVAALLARDFAERQCQVTGRLSRQLFDEACVFDGPGK